MKVFIIMFSFVSLHLFAQQTENGCVLISKKGSITYREAFKKEWKSAEIGLILKGRTTIKSNTNSIAKIKTYDGSIFTLPSQAQIEITELKKVNRDELVMELTAIELQKIPVQRDSIRQHQAFILHGAQKDTILKENVKGYIHLEENGAFSLFKQGYIPGFIIKSNRIIHTFPEYISNQLLLNLVRAYEIMKMPARMNLILKKLK